MKPGDMHSQATDMAVAIQRHLVLLGAGPAHMHLMARLARRPQPALRVTLVTPSTHHVDAATVPRFVAGLGTLDDCTVALEALTDKAGVRWLRRNALDLEPKSRVLLMDDGTEMPFDWLSIDIEPVLPRDRIQLTMPGARENALFIRPMGAFCNLWPRVTGLGANGAISVGVICDGTPGSQDLGMALAMAVRRRLPAAAVTLITGGTLVAASRSPAIQACLGEALRARRITVLTDHATHVERGDVYLGCGAHLACDVPVIAFAGQLPAWLGRCGLAMDDHGGITTDLCGRSMSHPSIFAAGTGPAAARHLAASLLATATGHAPRPQKTDPLALNILSCGDGRGIAIWRTHALHGRVPGWLKYGLDRVRLAQWRAGLPQAADRANIGPGRQATNNKSGDPHEPRYTAHQ
jgi:NADH dehydrogenase FAD-containing subunit